MIARGMLSVTKLLALAVMCLVFATSAYGQGVDPGRFISPGGLAAGHEKFEGVTNCTKCHDLAGGMKDEKCLACHDEIGNLIKTRRGFHANITVKEKKCVHCHTDHKGKTFDILWRWSRKESFEHDLTGYALRDKHKIPCDKCHAKKNKSGGATYLGLSADCKSCHEDPHRKTLGYDCAKCHDNYRSWKGKDVAFNHDLQTRYGLSGKHAEAACDKCHVRKNKGKAVFLVPGFENCKTCHKDPHMDTLGERCQGCHVNFNSWKKPDIKFDHDEDTDYPLENAHATVGCDKCHRDISRDRAVFQIKGYEYCVTCHKKDDKHKGSLGDKCENCHTTVKWKSLKFNHDTTRYPLRGKHNSVKCQSCHTKPGLYKFEKFGACDDPGCHDSPKRGRIHGAQFDERKCAECHSVEGFKPSLFTHDNPTYTGFKLRDGHRNVKCEKCHTKKDGIVVYKPIGYKTCSGAMCHDSPERGAIHGKQFAEKDCAACHNEKGWKPSLFRHDDPAYKGYRLEGKHGDVKCEKCHKPDSAAPMVEYAGKSYPNAVYKPIDATACNTPMCHEDPHKKMFDPKRCDTCHVTTGWKNMETKFDHDKDSGYPLTGKHKTAKCEGCHVNKKWKPLEKECVACHKKDDKHKGVLGATCNDCHITSGWAPLNKSHDVTGFPLRDTHAMLDCKDCHSRDDYTGLSSDCRNCHTDPHLNQFGAFCGACHTNRDWEPSKFRHSMTGFRLEGAHRFADCEQCHKNRVYRMTTGECYFCHRAEFFRPEAAPFHIAAHTDCRECHNTFTFKPATRGGAVR